MSSMRTKIGILIPLVLIGLFAACEEPGNTMTETRTVALEGASELAERHGALLVPRRMHVANEGRYFYWLAIRVESVDVDVKLDDHLFVGE